MVANTNVAGRPLLLWVNAGLKLALYALLLLAVARPDLEQFQGKAMNARAVIYPLASLLPLFGYLWWKRKHPGIAIPYPHIVDIFFTLPLLVDTTGNALDLYDTIVWWDDFNHFLNWFLGVTAFGALLIWKQAVNSKMKTGINLNTSSRLQASDSKVVWGLMVGFGSVTATLWEIGEYYTFIRDSDELATAYTDTLGDMALGLLGSATAAFLMVWLMHRRAPLELVATREPEVS